LIQFFIFLLAKAMTEDDELAQAVRDAEMFLANMGRTFYGINRRNLPFPES